MNKNEYLTNDYFSGWFDIEFVGDPTSREIEIAHPVVNGQNHYLYLVGSDGTVYNWSTIIKLTKLEK